MTDEAACGSPYVEYEQGAMEWDALVDADARRANLVFDRLHLLAKEIRESADGRAALVALMAHESTGVRLLAATECLAWDPASAQPVLVAIEDAGGLMP